MASYWFQAGVAAANAGDLPTAADALERSASADDYTFAWLDLAAVRWKLGDPTGARSALASAERLGWQRAPVAVAAGWLRWQLGDRSASINDYAAAVAAAPTLANDPFWSSDPALHAAKPAIIDAARRPIDGSPGTVADHIATLFMLQLLSGDPAAATAELAPLSAGDRTVYDHAVDAWLGSPGAEAALQQLAERDPRDSIAVAWCWLVAARNDEQDLMARYGAWLRVGFGSSPQISRIVFGPPLPRPWANLDQYGSLYRRSVPAAQVVGILPQITVQDHF